MIAQLRNQTTTARLQARQGGFPNLGQTAQVCMPAWIWWDEAPPDDPPGLRLASQGLRTTSSTMILSSERAGRVLDVNQLSTHNLAYPWSLLTAERPSSAGLTGLHFEPNMHDMERYDTE